MNLYRKFKLENPAIKQLAKTSTKQNNSFAALALAEKAEQCANQFLNEGKAEKAIYYFRKAVTWYGKVDNPKYKEMDKTIKQEAQFLGKIL